MNSWYTVSVKYTKQLDDGTFKRVSEPYLVAAMTHGDAEVRIYEELGALIRGEFLITGVRKTDVHDIFHYEDSDVWYKCKINFESADGGEEGARSKRVSQFFLLTAHNIGEAYARLHESLRGMLIDFRVPNISESPLLDVFPFGDDGEDPVAAEFEKQVKQEVGAHVMAQNRPQLPTDVVNKYPCRVCREMVDAETYEASEGLCEGCAAEDSDDE